MKRIWLLCLCLLLAAGVQAQEVYNSSGRNSHYRRPEKKTGFDPDRLVFGGGLGFNVWNNVTSFSIAPKIGYRITEHFAAGIGLGYQYYGVKDYFQVANWATYNYEYFNLKANIYTAGLWARYVVWENIFVHAEYEHNFMSYKEYPMDSSPSGVIEPYKVRYNVPTLLVGAGIRQPVSDKVSLNAMLLYDVIQDPRSPYYRSLSPQIGFLVGF